MTALGQTFSRDRDQHAGCLAFVLTKDQRGADVVEYVCTNVPGHDEQARRGAPGKARRGGGEGATACRARGRGQDRPRSAW
ncbi:hypothetical protein G5V59_26790 [Nocardioides sp. W3-2-3]|uniref:hypothetical protein n=1 Tax=Nocardioides convexus TaxID=2712224 RepID=UPI00241891AD|nr:hypothetical protein [Nocardioides convexus]NHA02001.1 hypothetical protein [Nocardioides convexus]